MSIRSLGLASVFVLAAACNQAPAPGATSQAAPAEQGAPAGAPTTQGSAPAATVPNTGTPPAGTSAAGAAPGAPAATSAANPVGDQKPAAAMMMEMTVPSGAPLEITLENSVSSEGSKAEDTVRGKVAKAVVVDGMTVIPAGAPIAGTVLEANPSGRVKGVASISIRFNRVTVANTPYNIRTARISREAEATKGEDAKKVGIGAGAGAVIGAIAGGKKGAAIGSVVGGGTGAGVVMATKGKEVSIPSGTTVKTTVEEPVKINAPM